MRLRKMNSLQAAQYNSHAKFMAEIAENVLLGNKNVLDTIGAKEIIGLYLMIPYATKVSLVLPDEKCVIPKITDDFCEHISISNLRDAICHSFVTAEESGNLILDDRAFHDRSSHDKLEDKTYCVNIPAKYVNKRLLGIFEEILKD